MKENHSVGWMSGSDTESMLAPALVLTFTCFQGAGESGPGFCTLQVLSEIIKV